MKITDILYSKIHGDLRAGSPYFRRKFGCLASEASVKNNQASLG